MRYPISIQTFEKIIEGGFVYVDKTDLVYQLAQENVCFLCRPRRFGKSLLISTLEAYFLGRKELFEGLKIMDYEHDWEQYPVFRLDFSGGDFTQPNTLAEVLNKHLSEWERQYGKDESLTDFGLRLQSVIQAAHKKTGKKAVVLIDEYDKPLLDVIEDPLEQVNRNILKGFYGTFKAADADLRFVLLTGVTKFSQISVFSGFNQPRDISMDAEYEAICGITEEELHAYFPEAVHAMAEKYKVTDEEVWQMLKRQYDGYHFGETLSDIYNPFSIINVLNEQKMQDYWYRSGTPTFLAKLISGHNINMEKLLKKSYPTSMFIDYRADVSDPLAMLYQRGYLTIKSYNRRNQSYVLDFPNAEVRNGFSAMVANDYFNRDVEMRSWILKIDDMLYEGRVEDLMEAFTAFFAGIDYRAEQKLKAASYEEHFHYTFYLITRMLSCYEPLIEKCSSRGRCDMVVETPEYVYIFEFKLNGTADEALAQIESQGYAEPYLNAPRQVIRLGVAFSQEKQNIQEWKMI